MQGRRQRVRESAIFIVPSVLYFFFNFCSWKYYGDMWEMDVRVRVHMSGTKYVRVKPAAPSHLDIEKRARKQAHTFHTHKNTQCIRKNLA